jgi:D-alanyl-D-alanine carboxypeptidase
MSRRAWTKALRSDTVTIVLVLIALALVTSMSVAWYVSHANKKPLAKPEPRFNTDIEQRLDAVMDTFVSQGRVPGAIVGIWVPGQGTFLRVRGFANNETHEPMTLEDRFRIASITKTFVATVVLQLVDEKKVGLDQPVSDFVPAVPNGGSITVRQLLNHTSGLFDFIEDDGFNKACLADHHRKWAPAELLVLSAAHAPYFAPGGGWHYSNTNYIALGMLVEKVTGHKLGDEIGRGILRPLQLKATSFLTSLQIQGPYSKGYSVVDGALRDDSDIDPSAGWASSAMMSDLGDLKVWAAALAEGHLVSDETHQESLSMLSTTSSNVYYGLGLMKWGGLHRAPGQRVRVQHGDVLHAVEARHHHRLPEQHP